MFIFPLKKKRFEQGLYQGKSTRDVQR
ncbi:unknown protein [Simkania negevensis Z]|uniref:Uncharacterized protein n=1 Tax=Simkania negevensis (strain ATCC VR-1471 / DSM 27360 / Z) TaxID=331113 RepID=F8L6Y9_SIMNZ|nr:unknown protein [Simkania negevensis Z]